MPGREIEASAAGRSTEFDPEVRALGFDSPVSYRNSGVISRFPICLRGTDAIHYGESVTRLNLIIDVK